MISKQRWPGGPWVPRPRAGLTLYALGVAGGFISSLFCGSSTERLSTRMFGFLLLRSLNAVGFSYETQVEHSAIILPKRMAVPEICK